MTNPQPPEPVCKAILLCQKTIVEDVTELVSLIGIFDSFLVGPSRISPPAEVFCQITEASGNYSISLEIQDLATGNVIAGADGVEIEVPDRLTRANVILPIPPIPFPHLGIYDFVVFANGLEIDRQQFSVAQLAS